MEQKIKVKVALTVIWLIISLTMSIGMASETYRGFIFSNFAVSFILITFPASLYWLGFWVWGDGYIKRYIIYLCLSSAKYVIDHWKGKIPLRKSFWINCILIGLIFRVITMSIGLSYENQKMSDNSKMSNFWKDFNATPVTILAKEPKTPKQDGGMLNDVGNYIGDYGQAFYQGAAKEAGRLADIGIASEAKVGNKITSGQLHNSAKAEIKGNFWSGLKVKPLPESHEAKEIIIDNKFASLGGIIKVVKQADQANTNVNDKNTFFSPDDVIEYLPNDYKQQNRIQQPEQKVLTQNLETEIIALLLLLILRVWQIVGTWRSATNYSIETQKAWGKVAKIWLLLSGVSLIRTIIQGVF